MYQPRSHVEAMSATKKRAVSRMLFFQPLAPSPSINAVILLAMNDSCMVASALSNSWLS
ncbi:hypothetical protein L228DRAFT_250877 [Xylona heveae TC161]|uniref:Uncharacterized protein n=1 Tax=Xylona heveae (strain CBS 132557 / TC161) TaxID=1328760 RepID=A0A165A0P0_XYLHT|nr:hypothetical protein L228DRAFT_250877 [Xylona heveae TC161]KZF19788.1 hypothetical protein L228DRAFT_250877 [Xylona heveae TC161]